MARSALLETINKKVISNALLSPKFCTAPIASTCRFRYPEMMGSRLPCTAPIPTSSIELVVDTLNRLHDSLGEHCIDAPGVLSMAGFRKNLDLIVRQCLCPRHLVDSNIQVLMGEYLEAITKAATSELSATTSVADKGRAIYVDQLYSSIGRTPRMKAEKAAYGQAYPGGGPASGPHHFTGRNPAHKPYTTSEGVSSGQAESQKRGRAPESFVPRKKGTTPSCDVAPGAWRHAITRYTTAWTNHHHFSDMVQAEPNKALKDILVFPCLTGKIKDVNETAVATFYDAVACDRPSIAIKFFRDELLSWHPDRIDLKFYSAKGKEEVKKMAATVFRVASEALEKARKDAGS